MMRALAPDVYHAVLTAVLPLLPQPAPDPLGRGRPRVSDELCFKGIWVRLITGSSWDTVEYLLNGAVSDTTLRARRDEWITAGVFDQLVAEAWRAYDRIIGLDLGNVAIDGSQHRSPCGGEGTGYNPFDRGKLGWKWVMTVDANGIPLGWATDGANRNDFALLQDVMDVTVANHDVVPIGRLHLDRGFSYKCTPKRLERFDITELVMKPRGGRQGNKRKLVGLGGTWIVESANSWFTNYGQLRRSTDRKTIHRHTAISLAVTIIILGRLIDHRDTYHRPRAA
jgi:transposase